MKIIDILNKKAEGTLEDGFTFKYNKEIYICENNEILTENYHIGLGCRYYLDEHLNDEVEVLEENKK